MVRQPGMITLTIVQRHLPSSAHTDHAWQLGRTMVDGSLGQVDDYSLATKPSDDNLYLSDFIG